MTSKVKPKVHTTLGRAADIPENPDISNIGNPIETSVFGLKDVLSLLETATSEVKHYVKYECEVMYECRVCRTIFRSLANFILHKRMYCTKSYRNSQQLNTEEEIIFNTEKVEEPKPKTIETVIDKLIEKQNDKKLTEEIINIDLTNETADTTTIAIEEIPNTKSAIFQTVVETPEKSEPSSELMQQQVMELHNLFSEDEAVLAPDGKLIQFNRKPKVPTTQSKTRYYCGICKQCFATRKTLVCHVRNKHNESRTVYPCPECLDQFASAWSVFRHLFKVHKKSGAQIRKMRDQIHASGFRKDRQPERKVETKAVTEKVDEVNQWMEDIESDNDLQMCGGCGRRFERKAALQSHSQICSKRKTVCNSIKENSKISENTNKEVTVVKGSMKRKPNIIRKKISKTTEENLDAKNVILIEDSETSDEDSPSKKIAKNAENQTLDSLCREYINTEEMSCISCALKFDSESTLLEHMSKHFNWFRFQCNRCRFMSYHKEACIVHITDEHEIETISGRHSVLSIPHWKTLNMSTEFQDLNNKKNTKITAESFFEKLDEVIMSEENMEETIEGDTQASKSEIKEMIMEIIVGNICSSTTITNQPTVSSRPIRNRTKTVQSDFVYDMKDILKATTSVKATKVTKIKRKNSTETTKQLSVTKPLKVYSRKTSHTESTLPDDSDS